MRRVLKALILAIAAIGVMMFGTAGSASAVCEDDSEHPQRPPTPGTPVPLTPLWTDTAGGAVEVGGSIAGVGSGETRVQGTTASYSLDSSSNPDLGWTQGQVSASGSGVEGDATASSGLIRGVIDANSDLNTAGGTDPLYKGEVFGANPIFDGGGELNTNDSGGLVPVLTDVEPVGDDGVGCID